MAFPVSSIAVLVILAGFGLHVQAGDPLKDLLSPLLSPIFDDVCKEVECGKGTCKASSNSTYFFECVCDSGWKQAAGSVLGDHLKFLPCIIPNCTMDYSCSEASAPAPPKGTSNHSLFDPCHWSVCGGGSCNKTSPFTYNCECSQGYYNLLNVTSLPCFKECAIGMDCSTLGITTSNTSASLAPPALSENGVNGARPTRQGTFFLLIMAMVSLVMLL